MKAATLVGARPPSAQTTVRFRRAGKEVEVGPSDATARMFASVEPWRTFRWYYGQKHYSGSYWSVTEGGHVIYESRLELARLILADFDPEVSHIVAQPFLLRAFVAERRRICRHVPDYLLVTRAGITVVAVKPAFRLQDPKVRATFAWVREVIKGTGWTFEVFTEPDPVVMANLRFIAGYRRPESVSASVLLALRSTALAGLRFGETIAAIDAPAPCVRAGLLHLLWRHELTVDLTKPLSAHTILNGERS